MNFFFSLNSFIERILLSKKALYFLFIANLIGALYGFIFYYGTKFALTPLHLWLFLPDCPLFSLFFALSILLIILKKENSQLFFFTLVGALEFGLWTVFVLLFYNNYYFNSENSFMYLVLLIAHLFLFLEAFLLIKKIKFNLTLLILPFVFLVLNVFSDYFLGTHPPLPLNQLNFMLYFTLISSVIFILISFILTKNN